MDTSFYEMPLRVWTVDGHVLAKRSTQAGGFCEVCDRPELSPNLQMKISLPVPSPAAFNKAMHALSFVCRILKDTFRYTSQSGTFHSEGICRYTLGQLVKESHFSCAIDTGIFHIAHMNILHCRGELALEFFSNLGIMSDKEGLAFSFGDELL